MSSLGAASPGRARAARGEAAVVQQIRPQLVYADAASRASPTFDSMQRSALAALDLFSLGILVVSAGCRLLHANAAADAILARGDGLSRTGSGHVVARSHAETQRLHCLVAAAASLAAAASSAAVGAVRVSCADLRPLLVTVSRLPPARHALPSHAPMAVLLAADPRARAAPPIEALCALYGLTAAEARLAAALAAGQSLQDYATGSGIARCTARWQLQQVLAKTDTHRQSDLVRLILAGPVGLLRTGEDS